MHTHPPTHTHTQVKNRELKIEELKQTEQKAIEEKERITETLKLVKQKLAAKEKELATEREKFRKLEVRATQLRDELER
jgi:hypothetical protein